LLVKLTNLLFDLALGRIELFVKSLGLGWVQTSKRVSEENPIMNLTLKFKVKRFTRTRVADWELVGPGSWPSPCPSPTLVLVHPLDWETGIS